LLYPKNTAYQRIVTLLSTGQPGDVRLFLRKATPKSATFCTPKVKNAVLSDQINNQPILPHTSSRQQVHEDRNWQPAEQ
jgi:hypothetical protein